MRFPQTAVAVAVAAVLLPFETAQGLALPKSGSLGSSSFARRGGGGGGAAAPRALHRRRHRGGVTMYEPGSDDGKKKKKDEIPSSSTSSSSSSSSPSSTADGVGAGVWSALADTERWISRTLDDANGTKAKSGNNPYARKEVTYVCETGEDVTSLVGAVWRRLREARETGESHGREEEARRTREGASYVPHTLRQTQVVVLPFCDDIVSSFRAFDDVINAVNGARRNARDLVTDVSLERNDERLMGEGGGEWVVSVNCAHLHPKYGEKSPSEILAEMEKQEDAENGGEFEVDLNVEAYRELRKKARQSPHPSLVLEVVASPPPDFGGNGIGGGAAGAAAESVGSEAEATRRDGGTGGGGGGGKGGEGVSSADVARLEALFGMSASLDRPNAAEEAKKEDEEEDVGGSEGEEMFWASIAKVDGIEEISSVTPLNLSRRWAAANDPSYDERTSRFVVADPGAVVHVDSAYEFVYLNAGMDRAALLADEEAASVDEDEKEEGGPLRRTYLALPAFLTSSATSFEKFAEEVANIAGAVPGLGGGSGSSGPFSGAEGMLTMDVSVFHPEHVDEERRSPVPLFVMEWQRRE